jgi:hypothetical protein
MLGHVPLVASQVAAMITVAGLLPEPGVHDCCRQPDCAPWFWHRPATVFGVLMSPPLQRPLGPHMAAVLVGHMSVGSSPPAAISVQRPA